MSKLRKYLILIVILAAIVLAAGFAWLNPHSIQLDLGIGLVETPVAYAFIACLAIGWLLGLLSALGWVMKLAARSRKERRAAKLAEAEAESLRKLSVVDDT
ncbi:MAG: hypothetical protein AMJ59_15425 [Gammaproteobacteria bacterium SG8_31]|jgi:uncharacterized integral membrane protein|nr:MAG: hypothetical protein AMJ59_15425 [Gammaproteobacteria bacterium SG8_31]